MYVTWVGGNASRACNASCLMSGCLIFQRPLICSTTSFESSLASTSASGSSRATICRPVTSPVYSATLFVVSPSNPRPRPQSDRLPHHELLFRTRQDQDFRANRRQPQRQNDPPSGRCRSNQNATTLLASHNFIGFCLDDRLEIGGRQLHVAAFAPTPRSGAAPTPPRLSRSLS